MVVGDLLLAYTPFIPSGSCSPGEILVWNRGFPTPLSVQRARANTQTYLCSTTPYSSYPVIAAAAVAAAATAYLHGTVTYPTPHTLTPTPPINNTTNDTTTNFVLNSTFTDHYNRSDPMRLSNVYIPTTSQYMTTLNDNMNPLPQSYYEPYENTLNTSNIHYSKLYNQPIYTRRSISTHSMNKPIENIVTSYLPFHSNTSSNNTSSMLTYDYQSSTLHHHHNHYATRLNLPQKSSYGYYHHGHDHDHHSTLSCSTPITITPPIMTNFNPINMNCIHQYHTTNNITDCTTTTTTTTITMTTTTTTNTTTNSSNRIRCDLNEESNLFRQPDSSSSTTLASFTSTIHHQTIHSFIIDIKKTLEEWILIKDITYSIDTTNNNNTTTYSNYHYHIELMRLWSNKLLKQISIILNKLHSFKQVWIQCFKNMAGNSNPFHNEHKEEDDDDNNNDDDEEEDYLWINELISQIEFYELQEYEVKTSIQLKSITPIPDTTQIIICELIDKECELLLKQSLPTLSLMHICQSIHNYQTEEIIIEQIKSLIYSIHRHPSPPSHHHHHHPPPPHPHLQPQQQQQRQQQQHDTSKYYKFNKPTPITSSQLTSNRSITNFDISQIETDLEQKSTNTNELWSSSISSRSNHSGSSNWNNNNNNDYIIYNKNNDSNLLLLISSIKRHNIDSFEWGCMRCFILLNSSLLNDSYTKSFELLKYTIHMMLIKHIIHKLKQQLHHNKQVTIATNHWILTYRLTQRIYNLLQISNELMNIQIYQNTTDKHLNE
ncbi:unnamed protein product [Schistosoma margrebowiei]|uniref:Uncharacterized protein n=1 Tax=Schistosoma margrebowiei TaxID=48269 RepID=A0A183MGY9_9TREM|nr:unnamed protein product [Schistosoma margrebowiei]